MWSKIRYKIFSYHTWKSFREITEWKEVGRYMWYDKEGKLHTMIARQQITRWETPEEYHSRKKDMITFTILGVTFTLKFRR